jgi:hypothetical protein
MCVCPYVMVLLTEHKVVNIAGQAYPLEVLLSFFARLWPCVIVFYICWNHLSIWTHAHLAEKLLEWFLIFASIGMETFTTILRNDELNWNQALKSMLIR